MREVAALTGFWMLLFPFAVFACDDWRDIPHGALGTAFVILWVDAIIHLLNYAGAR